MIMLSRQSKNDNTFSIIGDKVKMIMLFSKNDKVKMIMLFR